MHSFIIMPLLDLFQYIGTAAKSLHLIHHKSNSIKT